MDEKAIQPYCKKLSDRMIRMLSDMKKHGFSQQIAFRALAATGFSSIRSATNWLCAHIEDPLILSETAYDFFILLCPEGDFHDRLVDFIHQAQLILRWDPMFDFPVHISILHFEAPYFQVPIIHQNFQIAIQNFYERKSYLNYSLRLLNEDPTSITYQLLDPQTKLALDSLLLDIVKLLQKAGGESMRMLSEPVRSDYRLCLIQGASGRNLPPTVYDVLHACLGKATVGFQSFPCSWSIRLYSRDQHLRVNDPEVFEMLTTVDSDETTKAPVCNSNLAVNSEIHTNNNNSKALVTTEDETASVDCGPPTASQDTSVTERVVDILSHHPGDHILLTGTNSLAGRLGVPMGLNLNTGRVGHFNQATGRRVSQWHTWLLHSMTVLDFDGVLLYNNSGPFHHRSLSESASIPAHRPPDSPPTRPTNQSSLLVDCSPPIGPTAAPCTSPPCLPLARSNGNSDSSSSAASCSSAPQSSGIATATVAATTVTTTMNRTGSQSGGRSLRLHSQSSQWSPPVGGLEGSAHSSGGGRGLLSRKKRWLFVMRHAERVDYLFGRSWVTQSIDRKGVYRRLNMNLPPWLPPREDLLEYTVDSPVTQVGLFTAAETGRCLAEANVRFSACYSSPALRCVQTACELLRAMQLQPELMVRVEPHLFEYFGWYDQTRPRFMSTHELRASGYQVDVNYKPFSGQIDTNESIAVYYSRSGRLVKQILASHKTKDSSILIVGHASSLDACTHQLVHNPFRRCLSSHEDFQDRCASVPYCGLIVAEETRRWRLVQPPIPTACAYSQNKDVDWRHLMGISSRFCGIMSP